MNSKYDGPGNFQPFGLVALTYDAENRQTTAGANSYLYDGAGRRVGKTTASGTTTYVYDAFGQLAAEYGTATASSPCTTCYLSYDHLGSLRMVTDGGANVMARHDYAPFGQEIPAGVDGRTSLWGASDNVSQKFTGQVRDTETNLDFFQARYLSSGLGRFMSPDPANAGADITNPQSWNAYAYVSGNPLGTVDPSGMMGKDPDDWDGGCFEAGNPSPCYYPVDGGWSGGWGGGSNSGYGTVGSPSAPGSVSTGSTPAGSGSGGTGSASTGGSGGPVASSGEGPLPPGSFPGGETLGLPPGLRVPGPFGLPAGGCEFGACGGSFQQAAAGAIAGTVVCQIAEPCGAIEDAIVIGGAVISVGTSIYMAQHGRGGKADTGVMQEVYNRFPKMDICTALDILMKEAKAAGNTVKQGAIKATQKYYGCRGPRSF